MPTINKQLHRSNCDIDICPKLSIENTLFGMLIAMVAKHLGAKVVLSEVNAYRLEMAQSLGFATLNPQKVNIADEIYEHTASKDADVIFEVSGTQAGVDTMTEAAATRCRIVMVAIHGTKPTVHLATFV